MPAAQRRPAPLALCLDLGDQGGPKADLQPRTDLADRGGVQVGRASITLVPGILVAAAATGT